MLRAVWSDDKKTFDTVWKFTKTNLKRKQDNLFGWRWGKINGTNYGFLPDGGENAASDADSDIALALILANRRWKKDEYLVSAKVILSDMWKLETAEANGKRYLTAGNWADRGNELIINPSYFSPYAWRIFAEVDKKNDWNSLIDPAYELLHRSGTEKLDKEKGVGLPPNWVAIDKQTGELRAASIPNASTDYSFDAVRTPWRIAVDYQWNKDARAKQYLENAYNFLRNEYTAKQKLAGTYSHDGKPLSEIENPVMYSTSIGYFQIVDEKLAKDIYENKIIKLYSNADDSFDNRLPYYEQNWLWFGLALYNGQIRKY
jgi:endoglucanase